MNMRIDTLAAALALGLGMALAAVPAAAQTAAGAAHASAATTQTAPKLHQALRDLWHGHIVTTRDYALATFANSKARQKSAEAAVVANAKDIANAVAGFYGDAAGEGLLKLLGGHWAGVKTLTDSARASNAAGEDQAMNDLSANAGEIARFLAGANPNWKEADLQSALLMHGGDHRNQVDLMKRKAPQAQQAEAWQAMQHHMDMIADALADGIAKQFPDKAN